MWEQLKPLALLQQAKLHFLRLADYKYYEPEQNQSHWSSVVKYLTRWHVQCHSHACIKCLTAGSVFIFLIHFPSPPQAPSWHLHHLCLVVELWTDPSPSAFILNFLLPHPFHLFTFFTPLNLHHELCLAFGHSHSLCLPSQSASTAPGGSCSACWH